MSTPPLPPRPTLLPPPEKPAPLPPIEDPVMKSLLEEFDRYAPLLLSKKKAPPEELIEKYRRKMLDRSFNPISQSLIGSFDLIEALLIQPNKEIGEMYSIKNRRGRNIFLAVEETNLCTKCCCCKSRPFRISIFDNFSNEVLCLQRPLACNSCWFPCSMQKMEVFAQSTKIGSIEQKWSMICPSFVIRNDCGDRVLNLEGPSYLSMIFCRIVGFKFRTTRRFKHVGSILKASPQELKEEFIDPRNFMVTFPIDFNVKMKATMLGACFLMNYLYF